MSLRAKRSNLLQSNYLNLVDCFVAEFVLRKVEGLLAMTGERPFYEFIDFDTCILETPNPKLETNTMDTLYPFGYP